MNGGCPSNPEKLIGTKAGGSSCSTFADCKPTCCDCSSGDSYLAAACIDGVCATGGTACGKVNKSFFCGESSSSSGGSSSGGSSSGGSSSGGSSSGGTGGKTCVAGTYSSCYGNGMVWTGTECCVPGQQTCVDGTYSSCYGDPMSWTGEVCCVDAPVTCTSGTYSSCYGTGMHWTGAKCCIE